MREFILRAFTDDETEVCKRVGLEEIVRCKDYKYWHKENVSGTCELNICLASSDNWFCRDGKRREGSE